MRFITVYNHLFKYYGPQHWWPADTPFEVMVGAVLTQNTAWINVEKSIINLKEVDALLPEVIACVEHERLAEWVRPSGYFNVKAKRLQNFCQWYLQQGGYNRLAKLSDSELREAVLSVNGVGPETADDILLYAFDRPVFVIDAYTRRIFSRLGLVDERLPYEDMRRQFEKKLAKEQDRVALFNQFHALIVKHAKEHCRNKPMCKNCPLDKKCGFVR